MNAYLPPSTPHVVPYLVIKSLGTFLSFAREAFDAEIIQQTSNEHGDTYFAMLSISGALFYTQTVQDQQTIMNSSQYIYVPDVDSAFEKACELGASPICQPQDQPFGDRNACVLDKWGNYWWLGAYLGK